MLVPAGTEGRGEVAVARTVDLFDPGAQPVEGFVSFGSVEFPPLWCWRHLVGLAALGTVRSSCHLGEPAGERGNLLVEPTEGFQEGCLPVGQVLNGGSPFGGLGELAFQSVQAVDYLAAVASLALVEEREPFGVLGDLQLEAGDGVGRGVGVLVPCLG